MSQNTWVVEVGKDKGSYTSVHRGSRASQAIKLFDGYNVHSGGKKRLLRNGRLIRRVLTTKTTEVVFTEKEVLF